ncbi:MAG: hypothetical protein ABIJ14_00930 [Nanoarchaeota archaeon]|nr:hypothetical protein [Nanoarchaeota archaeon]
MCELEIKVDWSEANNKHNLQATISDILVGTATIEKSGASGMTKLVVKDAKGTIIDGYVQSSKGLDDEKKYAESSLINYWYK